MAPRCDPVVNWLAKTVRELQAEVKTLRKCISKSEEKATVISLFDALHQEAMSLQGQASNQYCALFADEDVQADALSLEPVKLGRSDSLKVSAVLPPAQQANSEEVIDKPDEASQDSRAIDTEVAVAPELTVYDFDPGPFDSSDEDSCFVEDTEDPRGIYWNQLRDDLQLLPSEVGEHAWIELHHTVAVRARSMVLNFVCPNFPSRRLARQGLAVAALAKMLKEWENVGPMDQFVRASHAVVGRIASLVFVPTTQQVPCSPKRSEEMGRVNHITTPPRPQPLRHTIGCLRHTIGCVTPPSTLWWEFSARISGSPATEAVIATRMAPCGHWIFARSCAKSGLGAAMASSL